MPGRRATKFQDRNAGSDRGQETVAAWPAPATQRQADSLELEPTIIEHQVAIADQSTNA
jgi:hypothetical protein